MRKIKTILILLTASFLFSVSFLFLPNFRDNFSFIYLAISGFLMFILGIYLIILSLKKKLPKKLKKNLLITGISASSIFAGAILHNVFYALEILTENVHILSLFMGFISGVIFIYSLLVAPIGFVVGVVRSGILIRKGKFSE